MKFILRVEKSTNERRGVFSLDEIVSLSNFHDENPPWKFTRCISFSRDLIEWENMKIDNE